ncbi:aldehyde dehydrogenase [Aminobacter sp. MSH1]|uniref:aldehyde dehydrogenase n=1 Tax=Aminobacter sp. MSH1 TaxID=374606 RepID=UPI001FE12382|nr:aldehyde dehydrogenase [Aminobacter sp. MSH1]
MSMHFQTPPSYNNFIAGKECAAASGKTFDTTNPTTGERWGDFALSSAEDVDAAVRAARKAFDGAWGEMSPALRGKLLTAWGERIAKNAQLIGSIESTQNGKLLAEMQLQATISEDWLRYFGGLADKIEGSVIPVARQSVLNYTLREPIGVIAVITAWNSPTFLNIMAAAPALAAGNTLVLKPSEVTSASAVELAKLAAEVGIPDGVVNVVTGYRETGEALIDHPLISKVSFVGSVHAGREIGARAGRRLITSTLELGGKSPNIVFGDADLELAEIGVLAGIFAAAGQTCVAGSRAYIHKSVYDRLVERLVIRANMIKLGDPLLADSQMGPIATKSQLEKDETMVARALECGAELLAGGSRRTVEGFPKGQFFAPTILHKVTGENPIIVNEVFGPVLAITPFESDEEVLALANNSEFGLAAGVWTNDIRRAHLMARKLQAGTVWINTYRALASNSPFGGYKSSGNGRNNGIESINQYLQTKSVWCELSTVAQDPFVLRA